MCTAMRLAGAMSAIMAMVAVAACSGGGSTYDGATDPSPTSSRFAEIAEKFRSSTYRATYRITGTEDAGESVLVWYKDGSDRLRFDVKSTSASDDGVVSIIETKDSAVTCVPRSHADPADGGTAKGFCFKNTGGTDSSFLAQLSVDLERIANGEITLVDTTTREVLGRSTECYRVREPDGRETQSCFTDDGIMLSAQAADQSVIDATDVTVSVSDADFALPYDITELPGDVLDVTPTP